MTQALILDFGGVISRTLFETHADTERALGLPAGTLQWRGPFDPAGDALWRAMQAGELTERDYWLQRTREVGRLVGEDWDRMETLVQRARGAEPDAVLRPETAALMREARAAGIRLAILSNELDLFYGRALRERMALLREVELIVDATYTGVLKPDPRAYTLCLEQLGLAATDAVFVDDQPRNIAGAVAVGLCCVAFDVTRPAEACRQARRLLGLPDPDLAGPPLAA
ncbi:HAD-IA family hydrolase [Ideonella sp. A 288]|uniref:HAD-IA family hydrolase n=1 Tax=Ideonella sp. A 288 TaxID=1962181 RepID=UPI000B4B22F8|nr:HAD-IA family hydrolase [Ideonella sp. A 288]